ncbi:NAD(P)-binding domain-containing protein, partial [Mycobacterium sp. E2238]|uniref:NAD(P)-binding domain-containing protein n=1 Tax=Mycobacterium sp. E2238 TaxID=1834131 RepID=UPI002101C494
MHRRPHRSRPRRCWPPARPGFPRTTPQNRAGFIGLGDQGKGMADRLIACGVPTTLWARRAESLEPYRGSAASFAETRAELGANSDVVGICVV